MTTMQAKPFLNENSFVVSFLPFIHSSFSSATGIMLSDGVKRVMKGLKFIVLIAFILFQKAFSFMNNKSATELLILLYFHYFFAPARSTLSLGCWRKKLLKKMKIHLAFV